MKSVMKIVKSEPNFSFAYNNIMITGSPSLTILDVSENDIGDDSIFFCLQHTNTLTWLSFGF